MFAKSHAITCVAALIVIGGCAVGPEYARPDERVPDAFVSGALPAQTASAPLAAGEPQRFVSGDLPPRWWTAFGSDALNGLVDAAFKANPNVAAARAAVRAAEEGALAQRGALYPSVQASLTSTRQKESEQLAPTLTSNAQVFTLHTPQLAVSYLFDVFGLNRRLLQSAEAAAESQRYQRDAAYLTLASNIVVGAVQEASLRAQLDAAQEIIHIETEQLRLMRRQFELGAIPRLNVVAQEAALAQAEAAVPPIEKQLAQQRHALAALAGRYPSEDSGAAFELASLRLPEQIPLSLPSSVVDRRPDVRAAEAQLKAASAQVGVATANMLPQITLTGSAGFAGTQLAGLFDPANVAWSLAAGLTQPIFQGGTLLHRKRAAEAVYEQAAAQYRAVVLAAFQNIADALRAIEIDARALQAAAKAESASRQNLDMTRKQLELGDIGYLGLLAAQQAYQQSVIARVQAQAARLADTAALFQAMGGPLPAPS